MKIAAAFVGGLLIGVFLGTLATKEEAALSDSDRNLIALAQQVEYARWVSEGRVGYAH